MFSDSLSFPRFQPRALACLGLVGLAMVAAWPPALAQERAMEPGTQTAADLTVTRFAQIRAMKGASLQPGAVVTTAGFHTAGDGGGATYRIQAPVEEQSANDADVIAIENGLVAVLLERQAVNYRMFGALGNGENDDGVQIKLAHQYADRHRIPVINRSGEFWILQTNDIPVTTNVDWGNTVFHIDERFNDRARPRFAIRNDEPTKTLELDDETKAALLEQVRPGVQIIPELAPYAGHLIIVQDTEDRIGIRAGNYHKRGWAREELFYVEEEGRIIGDIAWRFKDFTSVRAIPCNDNYLVVEGGGFYFSGDSPLDSRGYHHHGILIQRSRTIVREQWMGLEKGKRDVSTQPRKGFYVLSGVYDVTLENIRAMPWEKNRRDKSKAVSAGTYGIGGARMLNCTFRNLTAEAGWVSWGVFGTNLNKNFRLENCRLNRVDVHFHCWNLTISDCSIGFKGISVTGGGELLVENTTRDGNRFISFRRDYGSKWDGNIRLQNCTLRPVSEGSVSVLDYRMANFDYKYPIGYGRSIVIEDLTVDYRAAPESESPCWLINTVPFAETDAGDRLFFPDSVRFRKIRVVGREKGVRLLHVPNPGALYVNRPGGYDGAMLNPNCTIVCEDVALESAIPESPADNDSMHLLVGGGDRTAYVDAHALYPEIRFSDCDDVNVYLGQVTASAFFDRCSLNIVTAPELQGELVFQQCRFIPRLRKAPDTIYDLGSTLGTRFTNCTVHAPIIDGKPVPERVDSSGFLQLNESLRHYHINTALGQRILDYCRGNDLALSARFIGMLRLHHGMEQ